MSKSTWRCYSGFHVPLTYQEQQLYVYILLEITMTLSNVELKVFYSIKI